MSNLSKNRNSINMATDQDDWDRPVVTSHGLTTVVSTEPDIVVKEESAPNIFCDPGRGCFRFVILAGICLLSFGSYFCYDNPAALKNQIQGQLGISNSQYELFYEVYSYLNMIFTFFGGIILDKWIGLRFGSFLFALFTLLGQIVFALGASIGSFGCMVAGRFIFAIGGESIVVAQNTYCSKWFKGKELALSMGIALSIARIGSAVNFSVMPLIAKESSLSASLWVASIVCSISLFMSLVLWFLDRKGDRYLAAKQALEKTTPPPEEEIKFRDIKKLFSFKLVDFWIVMVICVLFYSAVFPFVSFAASFFGGVTCSYKDFDGKMDWKEDSNEMATLCTDPSPISHFNFPGTTANLYASIPYYLAAGASPFFGFTVDKLQRRPLFIIVASSLLLGVYGLFAFATITPLLGLVFFGISYTLLAASLWPCVPLIVPGNLVATAYGLMQAIQNAGLGASFAIVGILNDGAFKNYYFGSITFFAGCLGICVVLGVWLLISDRLKGAVLWGAKKSVKGQEYAVLDEAPAQYDVEEEEPLIPSVSRRSGADLRHQYFSRLGINR